MSAENYFNTLREEVDSARKRGRSGSGDEPSSDEDGVASFSNNTKKEKDCLKHFDENADGALDPAEFHNLCLQLFIKDGESSSLDKELSRKIFDQLDENKDGLIDEEEFHILWRYWLPLILTPKSALIIVDVQNDFITGTLPVADTEQIVPVINGLLDSVAFDHVYYTFDWHPKDHISFFENLSKRELSPTSKVAADEAKMYDTVVFDGPVPMEQVLWPAHCVQHSHGAELHPDLKVIDDRTDIYKGTDSNIDSYSAFFDNQRLSQTSLTDELCSRRITDIYTCGIAFDVCVKYTSLDGASLGFRTFFLEDVAKSITPEGEKSARREMTEAGCMLIPSSQVKSMVTGITRNAEMGLKAAVNVAQARSKAKEKLAKKNQCDGDKKTESSENISLLDL